MNQYSLGYFAAAIGAGMAVLGAGWGIGRLAAAAMEGTARQPSAGGDIRTSMIIAAAPSPKIIREVRTLPILSENFSTQTSRTGLPTSWSWRMASAIP